MCFKYSPFDTFLYFSKRRKNNLQWKRWPYSWLRASINAETGYIFLTKQQHSWNCSHEELQNDSQPSAPGKIHQGFILLLCGVHSSFCMCMQKKNHQTFSETKDYSTKKDSWTSLKTFRLWFKRYFVVVKDKHSLRVLASIRAAEIDSIDNVDRSGSEEYCKACNSFQNMTC